MERRLLAEARAVRPLLAGSVLLGIIAALATIAQIALLSRIVAHVFLGSRSLDQLRWPLTGLLLVVLVRGGANFGREVTGQLGATRLKMDLRDRLFTHVLRLGPTFIKGERTGELVSTETSAVDRLDPYFRNYLTQMLLTPIVMLAIAIAVLQTDLSSGLILIATAPVILLLLILVGGFASEHMRRQWLALSRMSAYFLDLLQGLPTLKLFGASKAEGERVDNVSEEFRRRTLDVLRYGFLSGLVLEFMSTVAIALLAVTLGVRLLSGGIGFQQAFFTILLAPEFFRPLRELGAHRHAGMEGKAAAVRIFQILDSPSPIHVETVQSCFPAGPVTIEIRDLTYRYPGSTFPALENVSLTLPAGSWTALVGPSGSGKSTLVNQLLRFVEPVTGTIVANGIPITSLPVATWREQIALVPQRPYLFAETVLENLLLARPSASEEEIARAAHLAGADEFIDSLPDGYLTTLGERGARLSQGQAQRIAIARAFLKDAPFLILDEPTSSLDPESETKMRGAVEQLAAGRTVLVVAHRLNTVYTADHIVVLDRGQVVEQGSHAELILSNGKYSELVRPREVVSL